MKRKAITLTLMFLVAWAAAGVWDCACLSAGPGPRTEEIQSGSVMPGCHHREPAEPPQSDTEDDGCLCCKMDAGFTSSLLFAEPPHAGSVINAAISNEQTKIASFRYQAARDFRNTAAVRHPNVTGVSLSGSPLYIVVQSLLI